MIRVRCHVDGLSRYLAYYFQSPDYWDQITSSSAGTGQPNVNGTKLKELRFPLPPPAMQVAIADRLDNLFEVINTCRARLARVPQILKKFREAVLEAAVSGRLTEEWRSHGRAGTCGRDLAVSAMASHLGAKRRSISEKTEVESIRELPESWGWLSGADAVEPGAEIVYGIVQPGPKLAHGVRYVRGMDIEQGRILIHQLMRTSPEIAKRYERASLQGGDVLLGIIRATKVAVVPDELNGANITQGTARFRPSAVIRSSYIARVLEAPLTQKWLHDRYRGIDMPGLNLADVRLVPIPLPSLEEQDEIIRRVNALFAFADILQRRYTDTMSGVERLTPSVLAKAFRGELVPQDPNDEPAREMLVRTQETTDKRAKGSGKAALTNPAGVMPQL